MLHNSLSFHRLGNFQETGNIRACHIVSFHAVLLRRFIQIVENIHHNALQLRIYFLECP